MLISTKWLNEHIDAELSPAEIASRLTMAGIEAGDSIEIGSRWDNVVVGEITRIRPHPNADKLSLADVSTGDRTYSVVCGAPNIAAGQKVPLALIGAVLPSGLTLKRTKIRGEVSEGMICSEPELELGDNASGIMVFDDSAVPGTPIAAHLNLNDTILDLDITPNRGDCLSVIGIAREVSAIFDVPLRTPRFHLHENTKPVSDMLAVEVKDPDLCPRYCARCITGVTVQPSPLWLRRRLESCGIRSINAIVDVTNYVLLEWGQPLHAFDARRIKDNTIIVRRAVQGDRLTTLDEQEHTLDTGCLLICDTSAPVAIGGIMGGLGSAVAPDSSTIILESAYFAPPSITRTSRTLDVKTEASLRFEKGVDINGLIPAINRAASLIAELTGGSVCRGCIDICPSPLPDNPPIKLSVSKANAALGTELTADQIKNICVRLGMHPSVSNDTLEVSAPSFRYDLSQPVDIIEEIARIYGYDTIPETLPKAALAAGSQDYAVLFSATLRSILTAQGFDEAINYSFYSPSDLESMALTPGDKRSRPVPLINPLSSAQSVMRTTLVPSLMRNACDNLNNNIDTLKLFEISTVFISSDNPTPDELRRVACIMTGLRGGDLWNQDKSHVDFFDIKGVVETLFNRLRISPYRFCTGNHEPYLHPRRSQYVYISDSCAGSFGEVHPDVTDSFDIKVPVYVFELDFDLLSSYYAKDVSYRPFSRYPSIFRDLALMVDKQIPADDISSAIAEYKNSLITEYWLFDVYHGRNVPDDKKSVAYRIKFQSPERTLTDSEVNKVHDKLLNFLQKKLGVALRP